MKCPVCKEVNLQMADRQGIEIDYCPECRGVWLDRGELDKIIERTMEEQKHSMGGESRHPGDFDKDKHKKKKHKSILSELLDF